MLDKRTIPDIIADFVLSFDKKITRCRIKQQESNNVQQNYINIRFLFYVMADFKVGVFFYAVVV